MRCTHHAGKEKSQALSQSGTPHRFNQSYIKTVTHRSRARMSLQMYSRQLVAAHILHKSGAYTFSGAIKPLIARVKTLMEDCSYEALIAMKVDVEGELSVAVVDYDSLSDTWDANMRALGKVQVMAFPNPTSDQWALLLKHEAGARFADHYKHTVVSAFLTYTVLSHWADQHLEGVESSILVDWACMEIAGQGNIITVLDAQVDGMNLRDIVSASRWTAEFSIATWKEQLSNAAIKRWINLLAASQWWERSTTNPVFGDIVPAFLENESVLVADNREEEWDDLMRKSRAEKGHGMAQQIESEGGDTSQANEMDLDRVEVVSRVKPDDVLCAVAIGEPTTRLTRDHLTHSTANYFGAGQEQVEFENGLRVFAPDVQDDVDFLRWVALHSIDGTSSGSRQLPCFFSLNYPEDGMDRNLFLRQIRNHLAQNVCVVLKGVPDGYVSLGWDLESHTKVMGGVERIVYESNVRAPESAIPTRRRASPKDFTSRVKEWSNDRISPRWQLADDQIHDLWRRWGYADKRQLRFDNVTKNGKEPLGVPAFAFAKNITDQSFWSVTGNRAWARVGTAGFVGHLRREFRGYVTAMRVENGTTICARLIPRADAYLAVERELVNAQRTRSNVDAMDKLLDKQDPLGYMVLMPGDIVIYPPGAWYTYYRAEHGITLGDHILLYDTMHLTERAIVVSIQGNVGTRSQIGYTISAVARVILEFGKNKGGTSKHVLRRAFNHAETVGIHTEFAKRPFLSMARLVVSPNHYVSNFEKDHDRTDVVKDVCNARRIILELAKHNNIDNAELYPPTSQHSSLQPRDGEDKDDFAVRAGLEMWTPPIPELEWWQMGEAMINVPQNLGQDIFVQLRADLV
ncbi:hypothetical protein BXZ70DRAFT_911724 [Cristinia sonorae]|uniref:Uncharacterized protein n=1 Tax=Cristinia sonorae TaxID=1940300 RepID=A0A8K0UCM3_9AGAR|nr:hypothetical protein BXZ70DRAFT_911724 [Cristinia sonorae]